MQALLTVYHPQALPPTNRRATIWAMIFATTGCLIAFVKRITAGLVS
jgi:hypothetical protein